MARTGKNAEPRPLAERQKPKRGGQEQREAHWQRLSREWEASGLTQREFCRQREVSLGSFCWWRCELARRDRQRVAASHPNKSTAREQDGAERAAEQTAQTGPSASEVAPFPAAFCKRKSTKPGRPRNEARREPAHVPCALPGQGTQSNHPFIPVQLVSSTGFLDPRIPGTDGPASYDSAPAPHITGQNRRGEGETALEVVLLSGRRIRIPGDFDASLLRKLIAVLEASPC
jgi:hypothetical protein